MDPSLDFLMDRSLARKSRQIEPFRSQSMFVIPVAYDVFENYELPLTTGRTMSQGLKAAIQFRLVSDRKMGRGSIISIQCLVVQIFPSKICETTSYQT